METLGGGPREAGPPRHGRPPRSGNGASSFHLAWELPAGPARSGLIEVSAVLEIVVPPEIPVLYFWALQVDFATDRGALGGGHTGLQWNPRYPVSAAVNWGGYASGERGGAVLSGTRSELPGFHDDDNTLSYHWLPARPYRLRVFRSPDLPGAWRSEVTDLVSGESSAVRDLFPGGPQGVESFLERPIVWSEVFADCSDPSVTARWSDLRAVDRGGNPVRPTAVLVNYQAWEAGGCPNTTVSVDEQGRLLQITNTERRIRQGTRLVL